MCRFLDFKLIISIYYNPHSVISDLLNCVKPQSFKRSSTQKPDEPYFSYRLGRKMVWKKVGKLSEGYGPEVAAELRAKTIMGRSTGQEVLTPKEERVERDRRDRTFGELAEIYFDTKRSGAQKVRSLIKIVIKATWPPVSAIAALERLSRNISKTSNETFQD